MNAHKIRSLFILAAVIAMLFGQGDAWARIKGQSVDSAGEISYSTFLTWRDQPGTVVLDAFELEPLFHVTRLKETDEAGGHQAGMSQERLNKILSQLIPAKDSRVVLYCRETFYPTRMVAATHTVASTLKELGYSNVYNLERLWDKPELKHQDNQMSAQGLAASEVIPFKKKLPEDAESFIRAHDENNSSEPKGSN